jgi:hypothetical protein
MTQSLWKSKFGACLVFVFLCSNGFAQSKKFSFKLGTEYALPRKTEDLAFFGNDKDGIINLSIKKEELIIVRFNGNTLSKTMEQKIDLPETGKNYFSETLVDFNNGHYYWVHSDRDRNTEKEMLYYDKIDVKNGKITSRDQQLIETQKLAYEPVSNNKMTN